MTAPMRAVVFDFDGVLVDSEPLHFEALRDALLPEGIAISREEYYAKYLAFDDHGSIRRALEEYGLVADAEQTDRIARRKAACFARIVE